jgi:hypothetical protein
LFQVGTVDGGEDAGDVAEDFELEALDFGRPEGFGWKERFAKSGGKGAEGKGGLRREC